MSLLINYSATKQFVDVERTRTNKKQDKNPLYQLHPPFCISISKIIKTKTTTKSPTNQHTIHVNTKSPTNQHITHYIYKYATTNWTNFIQLHIWKRHVTNKSIKWSQEYERWEDERGRHLQVERQDPVEVATGDRGKSQESAMQQRRGDLGLGGGERLSGEGGYIPSPSNGSLLGLPLISGLYCLGAA